MSDGHVNGPLATGQAGGDPPAMSRAARARAIRQRLRHPPNAVIDDGTDLSKQIARPAPPAARVESAAPTRPSEARDGRGHFANGRQLTVAKMLSLDQQINELVAELERLYERREQQYLTVVQRRPTTQTIQRVVAHHYGVTPADLLSARRTKNVAFARQVAIYLVRQHTLLSLPAIGRLFGHRDHTTVLYAARKIKALRERESELSETLDALTALIAPVPAHGHGPVDAGRQA